MAATTRRRTAGTATPRRRKAATMAATAATTSKRAAGNGLPRTTTPVSPAAQAAAGAAMKWLKKQVPTLPATFGQVAYAEGRQARAGLAAVIDEAIQPTRAAPKARSGTK